LIGSDLFLRHSPSLINVIPCILCPKTSSQKDDFIFILIPHCCSGWVSVVVVATRGEGDWIPRSLLRLGGSFVCYPGAFLSSLSFFFVSFYGDYEKEGLLRVPESAVQQSVIESNRQ